MANTAIRVSAWRKVQARYRYVPGVYAVVMFHVMVAYETSPSCDHSYVVSQSCNWLKAR